MITRHLFASLVAICIAATAIAADPPGRGPLAVVDFACAPGVDARDAWMATACEETLANRLRRVSGLTVIPTVRAYLARRELQETGSQTPDWARVLELLGAQRHVSGTVTGTPRRCELTLRVHERGRPAPSWQRSFGPQRLADVLDKAAVWLIEALTPDSPDGPRPGAAGAGACRSSALEYYAKAVIAARGERAGDASYYLERAMQYDDVPLAAHLMLAEIELRVSRDAQATALARLRHVQEQARARGDAHTALAAEMALAATLIASGSYESALLRLERALRTAGELDDPYAELGVRSAICDAHLRREAQPEPGRQADDAFREQELRAAAAALEQVLALLARLGDQIAEAPTANKLALVYERLDDAPRALAMHQRTLACARRTGSRRTQATALMFLGQWHKRQQDLSAARTAIEQCLELADPAGRPKVRIALADVLEQQGERSAALEMYEAAYQALFDSADLASQLLCLERIAVLAEQTNQRERAIAALRDAIDVAAVLESPRGVLLREWLAKLTK